MNDPYHIDHLRANADSRMEALEKEARDQRYAVFVMIFFALLFVLVMGAAIASRCIEPPLPTWMETGRAAK